MGRLKIPTMLIWMSSMWLISNSAILAQSETTPGVDTPAPSAVSPLATKEQMIRDRFSRFQDRVFRLREDLTEGEPENAQRLARAISRASELQLSEKLDRLVEILGSDSSLTEATDAQAAWLDDADRLLAILLERDSNDEERDQEINQLEQYKKEVNRILQAERKLRDASAKTAVAKRLKQQIDQAKKRLDAIQKAQQELSDQANKPSASGQQGKTEKPSQAQKDIARQTKQLAKDLENLSKLKPEDRADSQAGKDAREAAKQASKSLDQAGGQMQQAAKSLDGDQKSKAKQDQENAKKALEQARKQLEDATKALDEQSKADEQADQQQKVAGDTQSLSQQMKKSGGKKGKSGSSSKSQPPGTQNLDQAQQEMEDASDSLDQDEPGQATKKQENAIEELEQTQQELDKALEQLRKEEREEMLRDLEARFRDMLSRQRAINATTLTLDQVDQKSFGRAERLQLAELSSKEMKLGEDAAVCVRILDEDGTSIVVPRIIGQVSEDMAVVAKRLAKRLTGALTKAMEQEIVDTLEQLIDSVKQMQQENEQQGGQQQGGKDEEQPLLPVSAELKLLRASQLRVNARTNLVEQAKLKPGEPTEQLEKVYETIVQRQSQCAEMAQEMRDRQDQP